jgi:hypothetical protein
MIGLMTQDISEKFNMKSSPHSNPTQLKMKSDPVFKVRFSDLMNPNDNTNLNV